MQNNAYELLMKEAQELEKKYDWLQASELYRKAVDLAFEDNDYLNAAECEERRGYCFYRGAYQAQTNIEFKKLLKRAVQAYERESEILEKAKEKKSKGRIDHAHALIAYMRTSLEENHTKKKMLVDKWWLLERQVLKAYEDSDDLYSAGITCNNILEWSFYYRNFLFISLSKRITIFNEAIRLGEKAIQIFSKLNDKYELARAYCFVSLHYGGINWFIEDENKIIQLAKKCQDYANKALDLSQNIGDAWLISRSYGSAWSSAQQIKLDPVLGMKMAENMQRYGKIAKDNFLIGRGKQLISYSASFVAMQLEDPSKQREILGIAIKFSEEAINHFQIINQTVGLLNSYFSHSQALNFLAKIEIDPKTKQDLLELAGKVLQEGIEKGSEYVGSGLYFNLSVNLLFLSATKTDLVEKRELLQKAQYYLKKLWIKKEDGTYGPRQIANYLVLSRVGKRLANVETDSTKKLKMLKTAVIPIEKYIESIEEKKKIYTQSVFGKSFHFGQGYAELGEILQQIYFLTKEEKTLRKAIEAYNKAITFHKSSDLPTQVAESCWRAAQLIDLLGEWQKASDNYVLAAEAYDRASEKIPPLKQFYNDYSNYMRAWSQIEQGRYAHSIEEYNKAKKSYKKAAELHESTDSWNYLSSNYLAWAEMEEAESLSRNEQTELAKQTFQKAWQQFNRVEESVKEKLESIFSEEEGEMVQRLLKASDLRLKYCQARILMEEAKLLDREGKYIHSSKRYEEAAQNLFSLVKELDVEAERKELEYVAVLCQAWEKMAIAEETTSSESYLQAATLFEQAKEHCYTKKASLWALGNSNFCRGLAAGVRYQTSLESQEHARAKSFMKSASTNYAKAGFKAASEYARATQRLFDAYLFMNQAEVEADQEKRSKQYQMAENLLQIASDSFIKAKQPEKRDQVQDILINVREEKALAASLNEVMQAPTIASSTLSFTAPSPTSEMSAGLDQFQHANIQANLITQVKEVKVGESFCLSIEFVNAGKEPALLTRVEDFVPPNFTVVKKPEIYRLEESCLNMKGKQIAPLKLVEAKVVLQPSKKGIYELIPTVHYLDELGQNKSLRLKSVEIKVEEVVLADRVSTGTKELDALLLGGIPKECAIVLTGSPSDERELIIKNFLEAGTQEGQTSFYVSTEAAGLENLLKKKGFYLFQCNPKPKIEVPDLPNVTRLRSKTDLTNLNIALLKAYRNIEQSLNKRVCVKIVSDVLVDHGVKTTRKWIAELTTDLVSKGFTVLAVINPLMHTSEELYSILDLFDGEISLTQTEDPLECRKSLRIKKLRNQDYIKNPICLASPTKS